MSGIRYHVASCCNPHGETFTRKRQAVRVEKELNRDLRDESGRTLPHPKDWTDEQHERYSELIYDTVAVREHANGALEYGDVDPHDIRRIDWASV